MSDHQPRVLLPINLFVAIVAVSTASTFIRLAQAQGTPSLVIAAVRLTIATLILAPIAWMHYRAELRKLSRSDVVFAILAGLFLALHFATWISSLEYTSVASSVVFVSTGPLWVAILSPLLLNERVTGMVVFGLVLALIGATVIGLSDACVIQKGFQCPGLGQILQRRAMWGNSLALCGALAVSGYLLIGRKVRAKISLIPYIFLVYGICALVLNVFMVAVGAQPFGYPAKAYLWIFLLAVVPQLIGHSTFNWLLKYLSATLVTLTTLAEPIGSAILAYIFLRESPSRAVFIGGALILFGILLASRQNT